MIEVILVGLRQSRGVATLLLKENRDHGFHYVVPKLKKVPKKRLTKHIVQWIYKAPDYILYSEFYYNYYDTDVVALRDISNILNRPVYIIDRYKIF